MDSKSVNSVLPFARAIDSSRREQFEEYFRTAPLWILDAFQVEELEKGVTFVRENDPADTIFFVVKGVIKATDYRIFGVSYDFMTFNRVHAFGGMEFIMDLDVYRTTLRTVTKCTVVKIPRAKFEKWMYSDIKALKHEAKLVGEYLLEESRNNRLFLFMQGSDRLALLLVERHERHSKNGVLRVTEGRQGLADETGLCVKSITRAVKKFGDDGLLTKEGNRIIIDREQYEGLKKVVSQKIDRGI